MGRYSVPPMSRKDIEHFVTILRTIVTLGQDNETYYFDVVGLLETLHQFDDTFTYEYVSTDELPPQTYAQYLPLENKMQIDENVYLSACNGDARHRFTIAHEIGHFFLHSDKLSFKRVGKNDIVPAYEDPEWQANTFASLLLLPPKILLRINDISTICQKCGVSKQAARIALEKAKKAKQTA